jgi:hypothetical protein
MDQLSKRFEGGPAPVTEAAPRAKAKKAYYAATRTGMKKVTVTLDPATRKRLKRLALDMDTTVEALMREAIAALLARR